MVDQSFVHLHVHSEYSMLDGASRINNLVAAVAADGGSAVGLTDHGVLYGAVDFYRTAQSAGIKPIIGVEAYLTAGSRFDRPPGGGTRYHMTLLAENQTGYSNLLKLVSRAYTEGFFYKPRMDRELLSEYAEGLIATTGCLGGHVPQLLAPDASREEGNTGGVRNEQAALETAAMYQDIFGKDNFFVELHNHGMEAQERILPSLLNISQQLQAPLLATNDSHYTLPEQADAHDVLLCIQTGTNLDDPGRFRFDSKEYYLKSAQQMRQLFPEDQLPGACDNTLLIAERAQVKLEFGQLLLPHFQVPAGHTADTYLRVQVLEGAQVRYGQGFSSQVAERIEHELKIIVEMDFPDYFLIVWDLIQYAKQHGIRTGPGRGSAAGSIVAYCLGITDLDPIKYGLIFERFLNPGRREMPDIDMDFDERYRADVIRYVVNKYGSDHVAQIVTFASIKGKQAIRDSARVLGHPYVLGDRLVKLMPPAVLGREAALEVCLEPPPADADSVIKEWHANAAGLREAYQSDEDARQVIDTARGVENLRRQDSIHAAAVVIAPKPLTELVPVQRKGEDAEIVTQFEMGAIEALGLLKMDILGLRTLSTIDRCLDLVESSTGTRPDFDNVDLQDQKTFELLCRGDTVGVFQLEGTAMRSLIRSLQPDRFEDVIALVALYRPGPMSNDWHTAYADRKNGRRPVQYPHPATEAVLNDTYGLMIYQEQVMEIARQIAGYSMSDADSLRKAMGKKIAQIMQAERQKFIDGAVNNGHPAELGGSLFDSIEGFAGYGFNKSHSAAYGLLAYQTAYLKAHYPVEYMAALLTSVRRDKDKSAQYLNECRTMGIKVGTPSVNRSESDYTVDNGNIIFGLSAVRGVGPGAVEWIVEARQAGRFTDFQDFINRVNTTVLNKGIIESLIKAGAFDRLNHPRQGLFAVFRNMLDETLARRRNEDRGQYGLFGEENGTGDLQSVDIPAGEWEQKERLGYEKEMLGLYVSDHPLYGWENHLAEVTDGPIGDLWEGEDNSKVTIGGIVGSVNRRYTKKGELMAIFELEDLTHSVEVVAFPRTMSLWGRLISEDALVLVEGRLSRSDDEVKVRAATVGELIPSSAQNSGLPPMSPSPPIDTEPQVLRDPGPEPVVPAFAPPEAEEGSGLVRIRIPADEVSAKAEALKVILSQHPGSAQVVLVMTAGDHRQELRLDNYQVKPGPEFRSDMEGTFGSQVLV